MAQHGLSYVLVECTPTSDAMVSEQLVINGDVLQRRQVSELGLQDFAAFYAAHQDYLRALVNNFDSWAMFR